MRRATLGRGMLLASLAFSRGASAEPSSAKSAALSWVRLEGAEECVNARTLGDLIEQQLGRRVLVSASQAELAIDGFIAPNVPPPGFHAVVKVYDARGLLLGTRELQTASERCSSFNEELALVLTVLIDPDAVLGAPAPLGSLPAAEARCPPPPAPPVTPAPPRYQTQLEAGVGGVLGLMPRGAVGLSMRALVEPTWFWAIELEGLILPKQDLSAPGAGTTTFSLTEGSLSVCPLQGRAGRFGYRSCAGAMFGLLGSSSQGFNVEKDDLDKFVVGAELLAGLHVRLAGPWTVGLEGGVIVPFVRDGYYYTRVDGTHADLFRLDAVSLGASIGTGVAFP